jgi:2-acylglycerol O-acyltransferase 2
MAAWAHVQGRIAQAVLLVLWVGAPLSPLVLLGLVYLRMWVCATLFATVMAYPYVFTVRPWPAFADFLRSGADAFAQCQIVNEAPIESQGTLILFFPHGIFSWGYSYFGGLYKPMRPHKGAVATVLYWWPIFRYMALWTNCMMPAEKKDFMEAMAKQESFGLVPGGFEEATITKYQADRVFLKNRKGFVKYCLQFGYKVQLQYTFGESSTYYNLQGLWSLRMWLSKHNFPGTFFFGTWWCPVLPFASAKIVAVVSQPIQLPKIENPTPEDIDEWHSKIMQALKDLYDRHKAKYAHLGSASQLEIF